ncbi:MAG: hypothetical protein DRJ66_06635 [Thermoprotei archaeon]|nr:MAG: hypothetical protein DRJ66_06635 [Thermoprotei archaeon]RLF17313.1 MAG: hypothetical protein DRZ82_09955 [Thermoprotei archaeon]
MIVVKLIKLDEIDKSLIEFIEGYPIIEKETFSCFRCNKLREILAKINRKTLLLSGIETRICAFQTALDAIK